MKNTIAFIGALMVSALLIYGLYWVAKHGSYWLWYEDMVEETIIEMVKPEALKEKD